MIIATGIDLVETARLEKVLARRGNRFRDRVFTAGEIEYCEQRGSRMASYAARFAAKEAVMKALGTGWGSGVAWREIEVICGAGGAPRLELTGIALARFQSLGATSAHLSLTHSGGLAIAQVIFESRSIS